MRKTTHRHTKKGFTLIEVMLGAALLAGLLVGLVSLYVYGFDLQETSKNTNIALNAARAKLEEIRSYATQDSYANFTQVVNTYNNKTYNIAGLDGIMKTEAAYVGSGSELIDVNATACWRQRAGRIIGNATINGTGNFTDCTASPVGLSTAISNRQ